MVVRARDGRFVCYGLQDHLRRSLGAQFSFWNRLGGPSKNLRPPQTESLHTSFLRRPVARLPAEFLVGLGESLFWGGGKVQSWLVTPQSEPGREGPIFFFYSNQSTSILLECASILAASEGPHRFHEQSRESLNDIAAW